MDFEDGEVYGSRPVQEMVARSRTGQAPPRRALGTASTAAREAGGLSRRPQAEKTRARWCLDIELATACNARGLCSKNR